MGTGGSSMSPKKSDQATVFDTPTHQVAPIAAQKPSSAGLRHVPHDPLGVSFEYAGLSATTLKHVGCRSGLWCDAIVVAHGLWEPPCSSDSSASSTPSDSNVLGSHRWDLANAIPLKGFPALLQRSVEYDPDRPVRLANTTLESTLSQLGPIDGLVRHLDLSGCRKLRDSAMQVLCAAFVNLHHLDLSGCGNLKSDAVALLKGLGGTLKKLDLGRCAHMGDAAVSHAATWLPELEWLSMFGSAGLSDESGVHFAKLAELQSLILSACSHLSDAILVHLGKLSKLTSLDMSNCSVTDVGTVNLTGNGTVPPLKELALWGCSELSDSSATLFAQQLPELRVLLLKRADGIGGTGLEQIAGGARRLTRLDLSFVESVSHHVLEAIGTVQTLRHLCVSSCQAVTDAGISHLADLSDLRSLDVSFCPLITSVALKWVRKLLLLEELELSSCTEISDVEPLAGLCHLRDLRLSGCHLLKDDCGEHLARLRSLQQLTMAQCQSITGAFLVPFAKAAVGESESRSLQFLDVLVLNGTAIKFDEVPPSLMTLCGNRIFI